MVEADVYVDGPEVGASSYLTIRSVFGWVHAQWWVSSGSRCVYLIAAMMVHPRVRGRHQQRSVAGSKLVDHLQDHLPFGVPLLEIRESVGDLLKREDAVNHYLKVALIYERSQF